MGNSLIHIGTSGWHYEHWNHVFYPKMKPNDWLAFYAQNFATVEVNSTFYHLPSAYTVEKWSQQVPDLFTFSIKASRYITHMRHLKDCEDSVELMYERVELFGPKRGPILFQLPPSFHANSERLKEFLSYLKKGYHYVFEFRHDSWFTKEIYELLTKYEIGLCITDLGGKLSPEEVTSNIVYIRLHGPQKAYQGSYGTKMLEEWEEKILKWKSKKLNVYCYFDNDEKAYAVKDALELKSMMKV